MSASAGTLQIPASKRVRWGWVVGLVAAATLAAALIVNQGSDVSVSKATDPGVYRGRVTGTGPALEQISGSNLGAYRGAITGTGPGLASMATGNLSAYRGAITGTGPGLGRVVESRFAAYGDAVTGTGPGLATFGKSDFPTSAPVTSRGPGPSRMRG